MFHLLHYFAYVIAATASTCTSPVPLPVQGNSNPQATASSNVLLQKKRQYRRIAHNRKRGRKPWPHDPDTTKSHISQLETAKSHIEPYKKENRTECHLGNSNFLLVDDGKHARCIAIIEPQITPSYSMPILFWFHEYAGSASSCTDKIGTNEKHKLSVLVDQVGFTLVCLEGIQNVFGRRTWDVPTVINEETGMCDHKHTFEITYMENVIAALAKDRRYDTSTIFFGGVSLGGAMAQYISICYKLKSPSAVSAFITHSTGLKVKGDGLTMSTSNDGKYTWGDCPTCKYYPTIPHAFNDSLGLKACVFDNTLDSCPIYFSSKALMKEWKAKGNRVGASFERGRHAEINSFANIITCLDDGTGRLLRKGPLKDFATYSVLDFPYNIIGEVARRSYEAFGCKIVGVLYRWLVFLSLLALFVGFNCVASSFLKRNKQ